jgi:hypothetical protein
MGCLAPPSAGLQPASLHRRGSSGRRWTSAHHQAAGAHRQPSSGQAGKLKVRKAQSYMRPSKQTRVRDKAQCAHPQVRVNPQHASSCMQDKTPSCHAAG